MAAYLTRRTELRRFFAARLGAREADADDLMQELYLKLAEPRNGPEIVQPGPYLYRMASNLVLDRMRQARRTAQREDAWGASGLSDASTEPVAEAASAEQSMLSREALDRLLQAIDGLPPQTRRVFRMHRLDELSYREIAERLGVSVSAVEKHISLALQRLAWARPRP